MGFFDFLFRSRPAAAATPKPIPTVVVDHPTQGPKVVPVATRKANRWVAGGAAVAMAYTFIGGNEGIVQLAYPDPISKGEPWTICLGHTGPDVTPGLKLSMEQCKALFIKDVDKHWAPVEKCTGKDITDKWSNSRAVAVLDLVYNIGGGNYCKSSLPNLFKSGRDADACDKLLEFDKAFGMKIKSLSARRQRDRKLCLENI